LPKDRIRTSFHNPGTFPEISHDLQYKVIDHFPTVL